LRLPLRLPPGPAAIPLSSAAASSCERGTRRSCITCCS
jgi:hypothetical protein